MAGHEVRETSSLQSLSHILIQGILLAFLFVAPWFYGLTRFRDQLLAQIFIFSLFLIVSPFLFWKRGFKAPGSSFDRWVFASFAVGFFYVLFSSIPYQSLLAYFRLLSLAIIYGLVRRVVRTQKSFEVFLWTFLLVGVSYSGYGLLQYYGFLPSSFWYQPLCLSSRYVNGGHFGVLLFFPLLIGVSMFASSRNLIAQGLLIVFLLVMGCALLLTRSRAVWIACLAGIGMFVSLAGKNRFLNWKIVAGIVGAGTFFFLSRGGLEQVVGRFGELWSTRFYSLINRSNLWQESLSAIQARPWGWGLGTLVSVLPQYRVHADRFLIDYAHNEFLQVGVDMGILGVFLLAGFILFYFASAQSFLKRKGVSDSQKTRAAGFLALWVSLVLVSQVDFPLRIYATGILFATFLGLSAFLFEPQVIRNQGGAKGASWIVLWLLILVSNFITTRQLFAEIHFNDAKKLEKDFSWGRAEQEYERAIRLSPFFGPYHEALGSLFERRSGVTFNRDQRKVLQDKAIHAYQAASRLQPYRAHTHYLLASFYETRGDLSGARSEFLKAINLDPMNGLILSEFGHFALKHSFIEEGINTFERLTSLDFWGDAGIGPGEVLRLCYQYTQDYDQLRRVIPDSVSGHSDLGYLLGEKGRWGQAKMEFEEAMEKAWKVYPDYRPHFENVDRPIANFYLTHNRFQEALELYQAAAVWDPQDQEIQKKIEELNQKLKPTGPQLGLS